MEAYFLLVNLRKGMQGSSEQPLVGEEHCVTTLITAAKETSLHQPRGVAITLRMRATVSPGRYQATVVFL